MKIRLKLKHPLKQHPQTVLPEPTEGSGATLAGALARTRRHNRKISPANKYRKPPSQFCPNRPGQGGHSVLGSISVPSVIDEIRFLENGNRSVPKFLETEHFGSRLFWFGFGSNRIFSEDLKTIINILVLR